MMTLHPGVVIALKRLTSDELGVARMMAAGELTSPQKYENIELFAVRITGTGLSYRQGLDEHVWRNPEHYCNDEFLARCAGLPVIWEHPPRAVLDGDEFARRIIGTVFLPYVQGSEVWAIAKIYDPQAAKMMEEGQLSTSPSVVFRDETVNDRVQSGDGRSLLFEGKPSLLDHLAVCELGVWDKGGAPTGVRSDNQEDRTMADETEEKGKGAGDGEKLDKLLEHLGSMSSSMENLTARMDAMEAKGKADSAKKDEETEEEKRARLSEEAKRSDSNTRADSYSQRHAAEAANEHALAVIQARADAAYNLHGRRAEAPLAGEKQTAYRVRMLRQHQKFSPGYKAVNLDAIAHADPAAFETIETQIYADSAAEAARPTMFSNDEIQCRTRYDKALDRNVREYVGRHTFVKEMGLPARPVVSINLDPNRVFRAG